MSHPGRGLRLHQMNGGRVEPSSPVNPQSQGRHDLTSPQHVLARGPPSCGSVPGDEGSSQLLQGSIICRDAFLGSIDTFMDCRSTRETLGPVPDMKVWMSESLMLGWVPSSLKR